MHNEIVGLFYVLKWEGDCPVFRGELKKDSKLQKGDIDVWAASDILCCPPRTGRELERQDSHARAGTVGEARRVYGRPRTRRVCHLGRTTGRRGGEVLTHRCC